jgi:uncharacterized protein (DUF1697 family)
LLRGVNVGGNNKLSMRPLAVALEAEGLRDVRTYIQSGNIVFRAASRSQAQLAARIAGVMQSEFAITAPVLVLSLMELRAAALGNPFPEVGGEAQGGRLHLHFLAQEPVRADRAKLENLRAGAERWALLGKVLYLHTPDGAGKSKLMAQAEKALGVPATARNWRTVCALLELAAGERAAGELEA